MNKFTVKTERFTMVVKLPEDFNVYGLIDAWAQAYVEAIDESISDEMLVNEKECRKILEDRIQKKLSGEKKDVFLRGVKDDDLWARAVLAAKHGRKGKEIYLREYSGFPDDVIEFMLAEA